MGINSPEKIIRKPRLIENPKEVQEILSISAEKAACKSTIMDLFADFGNGPKYNTYDIIRIPPNSYGKTKKNKNEFTTTVGIYIFNKGMIEDMSDELGYINKSITADVYDEINEAVSYARLEDRITLQQLKDFIMQSQIYMSCASAICPSHTMAMLLCTNEIEEKKVQLEKKYKKAIEENDIRGITDMTNELLDFSKEHLKGDPSTDMYNSGARSKWGNNFKNMYVTKGVIAGSDGSYKYVRSSYISGLDKEDLAATNDSAVAGPYARAVNTEKGGYKEKLLLFGLQHLKVLPEGSDCHTNRTITVTLTKKNIKGWMYCFVVQGGREIEITSKNKDSFIGKTVKMRYSAMCEAKDGICEKCAGTLFRRLGIYNVGLACDALMSRQKNVSMKQFHDSTLNLYVIDVEKIFGN